MNRIENAFNLDFFKTIYFRRLAFALFGLFIGLEGFTSQGNRWDVHGDKGMLSNFCEFTEKLSGSIASIVREFPYLRPWLRKVPKICFQYH